MTKDEALKLAQRALSNKNAPTKLIYEALTAIKAALEAKDEPWEKFCDSNCVWTDHHPDCKLAKDEPDKYAMDIECNKCGAKQSGVLTVHTSPPQRKPLTNEEITQAFNKAMAERPKDASNAETNRLFVRAIEAAHGIKEAS